MLRCCVLYFLNPCVFYIYLADPHVVIIITVSAFVIKSGSIHAAIHL